MLGYGRLADPDGLRYWSDRLDAEGGNLDSIIAAFGESQEFNKRFGDLSHAELISNISGISLQLPVTSSILRGRGLETSIDADVLASLLELVDSAAASLNAWYQSIIAGNTVHYIHDDQVWSSSWDGTAAVHGPE